MITDSLKINLFSFWILSFFLNSAIHFAHIQRPCSNRKKKKRINPPILPRIENEEEKKKTNRSILHFRQKFGSAK